MTNLTIPAQTRQFLGSATFGLNRIADGVSPTAIFGFVDGERMKLGNFQPDFQMSLSSSLTYSNFEFSFLIGGSKGAELVNLSSLLSDGRGNTYNYWIEGKAKENTDRLEPGSKRFVDDGDYIKLREVSLYYTLPSNLIRKAFSGAVKNIEVGLSGTNLFMITNYDGYDPEVNFEGRSALMTSVSITPYPSSRQVMFHVNFKF